MTTPKNKKTLRYSVEVNIFAVDAPGTRLTNRNDIYLNICLLGIHKRTRLMPPNLPLHIDQKFYFDKTFKSCQDPRDIIQRLEREHVLIELLEHGGPSPVVLATYETSAKEFIYPYSYDRVQYTGLRRYLLLNRTIDFPGISPSLEFTVSPSIDDFSGSAKTTKTQRSPKPINSHGRSPKRSKSPVWKPSSAYPNRSSLHNSNSVSRSLTSHTISSAVKNDYAQRDTQEKLRELAIPGEVKYVVPIDNTIGRRPFVVRHVDNSLIGRQPKSHMVLNDGLVVNDYSLSRVDSSYSLHSSNGDGSRSRPTSSANTRNIHSSGGRARSSSPARRSAKTSHSVDHQRRDRSPSPQRPSNLRSSTSRSHNANSNDYHSKDDEYHSTKDCAICRLHSVHSARSRRAKYVEQQQFATNSKYKSYSPGIYSNTHSRPVTSATLVREPFRYRHRHSPAGDLSDKIIHTLRRNLESYNSQPWHKYYSAFRYSDGHTNDDQFSDANHRTTQD